MIRRAAALLVLLTTFHLSVVAGDLACADHGAASASEGHAMAMDMPATHDARGSTAQAAEPPCEVPVQQHCCEAVASCGVTGDVAVTVRAVTRVADAPQLIREPWTRAPESFVAPPEPPPPKA